MENFVYLLDIRIFLFVGQFVAVWYIREVVAGITKHIQPVHCRIMIFCPTKKIFQMQWWFSNQGVPFSSEFLKQGSSVPFKSKYRDRNPLSLSKNKLKKLGRQQYLWTSNPLSLAVSKSNPKNDSNSEELEPNDEGARSNKGDFFCRNDFELHTKQQPHMMADWGVAQLPVSKQGEGSILEVKSFKKLKNAGK